MATDRDEQQHQQQELEEIRRSFAEMGARMGSLFEPAQPDESDRATAAVPPPASPAGERRPRWQLAAVAVLLLLLGTVFGWALGQGGGDDPPAQATPAPTTAKPAEQPTTTTARPQVRTVVPEECVDTAELADEVISRLNRNVRDERLFLALRDYTIASQACRREASP